MAKSPDPTKDAKFQDVVKHFLKTPPKPHAPKGKAKVSPAKASKVEKRAAEKTRKNLQP